MSESTTLTPEQQKAASKAYATGFCAQARFSKGNDGKRVTLDQAKVACANAQVLTEKIQERKNAFKKVILSEGDDKA